MAVLCVIQTGCKRTASDVWEDTKTASRQVGKGIRSLSGNHSVSRQIACAEDFRGPSEHEFIPLRDDDIGERMHLASSSQSINIPGENGCSVPGIDGFRAPYGREMGIFQPAYFAKNEYAITGANRDAISTVASHMQKNPDLHVFIEGHCDETGSAAYNLALGAKRANAVRSELIKEGVDPDHVYTISYGKERPCSPDCAKNRRSEYKLYQQ